MVDLLTVPVSDLADRWRRLTPSGVGVDAVIGVGIDLVDIERFREVLARRPSMRQRLFTDGERRLAAGRDGPRAGAWRRGSRPRRR